VGLRCLGSLALLAIGTVSPLWAQSTPSDDPADDAVQIQVVGSQDRYAPVTLSARELDIRDVLTMLSRSRGLNIVATDEVRGLVTLELHGVPFQEALRAVVAVAGFEVSKKGDIWFVYRPEGEDPALSVTRETRSFRLDYAQAEDLISVVEEILSPIGSAISYPPLRTIVVEDRPLVLDRIRAVLAALDSPPRQVVIEAQIIEAQLSKDWRFGIDWSHVFSSAKGSGEILVDGFAAPPGSGEGMFVTWAGDDFMASLEAVEGISNLQVLAAPRLLAIDGSDASIMIGGQLGFYVTRTIENQVLQSVEFLDTGTQLIVTPTIAGDGYIQMRIHPELSDGVVEQGLPSKTTAQVTSNVLVRDGDTLLIGGIIREREETTRKGIPLLVRLPLIGGLFGKTVRQVQRS
jgi:type II secretory pathway component GspD/PulD (secretin)